MTRRIAQTRSGAAARFRPAPGRARRRRLRPLLGALAAALLGGLVLGAALLWLRLAEGPVSLAALTPRIAAAASAELEGGRLTIGDAVLTLGAADDPRPGLRFLDVALTDRRGRAVFAADRVRVEFRPLDLLTGRIRPTAAVITGASARVVRLRDGRFSAGVTAGGEDAAPAEVAGILETGLLSALDRVELADVRLTYVDRIARRVWRADRADLVIRREGDRFEAVASALAQGGALGPTYVRLEGTRAADASAALTATFSGVAPADIASQFDQLAALTALDAPVQGRMAVALAPDGGLRAFSADLRAAAGRIALDGVSEPLDAARLAFALDPEAMRIDLRALSLQGPRGAVSASGAVTLTAPPERRAVVELTLDEAVLSDPDLFAAPVRFDGGAVVARLGGDPMRVEIGKLALSRGDFRARVSGEATEGPEGWRGRLAAEGGGLDLAGLLALWPERAAPGARNWVEENMAAARVPRLDAALRFGDGAPRFGVTFAVEDAVAHFLRPMPPVTGASGWAELTPERFSLTLAEGAVDPGEGRPLSLAGSAVRIALDVDPEIATIEVDAEGPLTGALDLLDREPLSLLSRLGRAPVARRGEARAEATVTLPLLKELPAEDVAVSAEAVVTDVAFTPPDLDAEVEAERLEIAADTERLSLSGDARIGGFPATLALTERFDPPDGAAASEIALSGRITPELLDRMGVALPDTLGPRPFAGAAPFRATAARDADGMRISASLDLEPAALAVAPLGWDKPAGAPARATLAGRLGDGATLDRFAIEAPSLEASGSARIGADGALRRLTLDRLRRGAGTDVALTLRRQNRGFSLDVTGPRLDLAPLRAALDGDAETTGRTGPPLEARLAVGRLGLGPLGVLEDAEGEVERDAEGALRATLSGRIGGAAQTRLSLSMAPGGAGRLRLDTADAGALLRGLDLFPDAVGGELTAEATLAEGPGLALEGWATVARVTVADDATLRAMIAKADAPEVRRELERQGLTFESVSARFALDDSTLTLRDGLASGPAIGLTLEGRYDLAGDRLDMRGVFTPLYGLNAALSGVPLLGPLLTGGEGEGVFAFNYTVRGPAETPEIAVNPLSGLFPGPLRKLLEARIDGMD